MTKPIVSVRQLTFRYRGQKRNALDDVSFDIFPGEFFVIMGASEAGKSTLASSFNGLIPHFFRGKFQGEVQVCEKQTTTARVAELSPLVGLVFQDFEAQIFSTNVELEVAFGLENLGVPREEMVRRVDDALRFVGLDTVRHRSPASLSGGQKQKLAIASVLAMRPKVLVMDEPTTDLDPLSKAEVYAITNRLRQQGDLTLVVVEHDSEEILDADRILVLANGQVARLDHAQTVLRDVDFLNQHGIMPVGITTYFRRMGDSVNAPLTIGEAVHAFTQHGWSISDQAYARLVERDHAREQCYGQPVIQVENLQFDYPDGTPVLKGVDLVIRRGEMVAILGQNASGKTTLIKHFNGLLYPTRGRVLVDGKPTREQSLFELSQKVGYVFQNPDHQLFAETVYDEVAFPLRLRRLDERTIQYAVTEALEAVGLAGYERADPFTLTKSGRQRVALASVLATKPEILILDEPTTGLDYHEQRSMMNLVQRLNENGSTIIFVTHHMWVAAEYAHRIYVVKDGQLIAHGTAREVFAREGELLAAGLRPPLHVSFANRLGKTLLTVDELLACTEVLPREHAGYESRSLP